MICANLTDLILNSDKSKVLFTPKKTEHDVKIVKIVNIFKKIRNIAILMRKDVPNPGKLVW